MVISQTIAGCDMEQAYAKKGGTDQQVSNVKHRTSPSAIIRYFGKDERHEN
jgi:hypothetical protein